MAVVAGATFALTLTTTQAAAEPEVPDLAATADLASAHMQALEQGERVEVLDLRTEKSQTFANPDGTSTYEAYTAPAWMKDAEGQWQTLNANLVDTGARLEPKVSKLDISFSDGGSDELVTLDQKREVNGRKTALSLGLSWVKNLPEPVVEGNKATYRNVIPGGDLYVKSYRQGFEHSLVLNERPSEPLTIKFPVDLDHLELDETKRGGLSLTDAAGERLAEAPAPRMWGAEVDEASGDPTRSANIDMTVTDTDEGAMLTLRPDPAFLADPAVTYPVILDPTTSLGVDADTWASSDAPGTDLSKSTELRAGTYNGGWSKEQSYVRFEMEWPVVGQHIIAARFKLRNWTSGGCSPRLVQARRVTSIWGAPSLNWNNQPSSDTFGMGQVNAAYGGPGCPDHGTIEFNVDQIVQSWANYTADVHGFQVRAADQNDSAARKTFMSANFASAVHWAEPKLEIHYMAPPDQPTTQLAGGPSTGHVSVLSPTLEARFVDPDYTLPATRRARFHISLPSSDGGVGTYVWSGWGTTTTGAPGGPPSTFTVKPGVLQPGRSYTWYAVASDGLAESWASANRRLVVSDSAVGAVSQNVSAAGGDRLLNIEISRAETDPIPAAYEVRLWSTDGYHLGEYQLCGSCGYLVLDELNNGAPYVVTVVQRNGTGAVGPPAQTTGVPQETTGAPNAAMACDAVAGTADACTSELRSVLEQSSTGGILTLAGSGLAQRYEALHSASVNGEIPGAAIVELGEDDLLPEGEPVIQGVIPTGAEQSENVRYQATQQQRVRGYRKYTAKLRLHVPAGNGNPERNNHGCSGTLVSSNTVLTAGHCVYVRKNKQHADHGFVYFGGALSQSSSLGWCTISRVWALEKWVTKGNQESDLGAVRLTNCRRSDGSLYPNGAIGAEIGHMGVWHNTDDDNGNVIEPSSVRLNGLPCEPIGNCSDLYTGFTTMEVWNTGKYRSDLKVTQGDSGAGLRPRYSAHRGDVIAVHHGHVKDKIYTVWLHKWAIHKRLNRGDVEVIRAWIAS